jgi:hypothetical protein
MPATIFTEEEATMFHLWMWSMKERLKAKTYLGMWPMERVAAICYWSWS